MHFSIILPCYNEENSIQQTINALFDFMTAYDFEYEIIAVNDGSHDNTLKIIEEISSLSPIVKFVSYSRNQGKGHAVKAGINAAAGNYILFMDTDLSTDLSAIDLFLKEIQHNDIVIGSRRHKNSELSKPQKVLRRFIGNCCVIITKIITGIPFTDTQCGFKGFTKSIAQELISKQQINGWAFDVEYLYIAKLNHYKVKDIPVKWTNNEDSKVSPFKSSVSFFIDLLKIAAKRRAYQN